MVWFWSSPAAKPELSSSPPPTPPTPTAAPTHPSSQPRSREEQADLEWASLLQELEADLKPSSTKYNRVPKTPPPPSNTSKTTPQSTQSSPSDRSLTLEESLLPISISCRQTFDNAFYCQSFGGQFNNLYRYGGIRDCSELWSDFWFCMKTRTLGGESKDAMVRDRYKRKALKYKVGPSSEDVWESREQKVSPGEAFVEKFEEDLGSDEEWNRRERARRDGRVLGTTT